MKDRYYKDDKMHEMLADDERLLQVISRFSIPLGVGEKSIDQVCKENNIDTTTFLAVVNYTTTKALSSVTSENIDLPTLLIYLKNTHTYFLKYFIPNLKRKLIDALGDSSNNDITFSIIKFFDNYTSELQKHITNENKQVFPYVERLLQGEKMKKPSFDMTLIHRIPIEQKLTDLKNIIIKYYVSKSNNVLIYDVLNDLFTIERDISVHSMIEENLFMKQVKKLENSFNTNNEEIMTDAEELTQREKDIIKCVVKGLTNKETADKLCISINTVTTHRRNIAKKLDIHSPSGLTIFAIVNHLVDVKEIEL